MESSRMKIVYNISERNGRSFWNRIGVAFVNADGSLNVKLESLPVNGELQVRDYVPREDGESARDRCNGRTRSGSRVSRSRTITL